MSDNIKNNLEKIRIASKLTRKQLAEKAGLHEVTIYNIETGRREINRSLYHLATALGCKPEDLIAEDLDTEKLHLNNTDENNSKISIKLYDAKASAGKGIINHNEDYFSFELVLPLFNATTGLNLKETDIRKNRFSFIKVEGDSMSTHINHDDLILVDHDKINIEHHRQILVFRDAEGQLFIKEMHIPYTNKLSIISYNKSYRSWEEEDKNKVLEMFGGEINIIGKVIWHGRKIDYFR